MAKSRKDWYFISIQLLIFLAYFSSKNFLIIELPHFLFWMGILLKATGLVLILVAIIQFKVFLSPFPSPKKGQKLLTNGVFKLSRHPIYLGIFLFFLGSGISSGGVITIIVSFVFIGFAYIKARYEETLLTLKFSDYKNYQKKTRMFL